MDAATYRSRRDRLRPVAGDGLILVLGHDLLPRNYPDNVFPFRQSSHLLYLSGVNRPGVALLVGGSPEDDVLFGPPEHIDDVVWHGAHATLEDEAREAGIGRVADVALLGRTLAAHRDRGLPLHYLAPVQHGVLLRLAAMLGTTPEAAREGASPALARAVVALRLVKERAEVAEIEEALHVTRAMHLAAMRATRPGVREADVMAAVEAVALAENRAQSYNPIVTVHGEVLHNDTYHHELEDGQILLNDSGAESSRGYASDITRAYPVNGRFSADQRAVYEVVLEAQRAAIARIRPGVTYRDVHLDASRVIAEGLARVGLMRGRQDDAVAAGAHALFFPHGLGHMLGLDVHDMEDLGDLVGYGEGAARSTQFGLNYLRLARPLEEGHVFTVEPGVYFIPALIDRWRAEGRHREFIDYDRVERFRRFGGIRIEDDVLCTKDGARVLGPPIPKTVADLEEILA